MPPGMGGFNGMNNFNMSNGVDIPSSGSETSTIPITNFSK